MSQITPSAVEHVSHLAADNPNELVSSIITDALSSTVTSSSSIEPNNDFTDSFADMIVETAGKNSKVYS